MNLVNRLVLWKNLRYSGIEYCKLSGDSHGWELNGTVVMALDSKPLHVVYNVSCDESWRSRSAKVELQSGSVVSNASLVVDERQNWSIDGKVVESLQGCFDVDLGISPSTNTLAIRRVNLSVGMSIELEASWVRFPDLSVTRLQQKYTRLDANRYRYESGKGSFIAEIDVDELGLVTRYQGVWERIASVDG